MPIIGTNALFLVLSPNAPQAARLLSTLTLSMPYPVARVLVTNKLHTSRSQAQFLPIPFDILAGQDLAELKDKSLALEKAKKEAAATADGKKTADVNGDAPKETSEPAAEEASKDSDSVEASDGDEKEVPEAPEISVEAKVAAVESQSEAKPSIESKEFSEENSIFLGLTVYSNKDVGPVAITGTLRHEMELSAALALP